MEFQVRNKTFISSMVGISAAVVLAGSANAAIVSASGVDGNSGAGQLMIFASGLWDGNGTETPIAGFPGTLNDGRARYFNASYTSGSDGNFGESVPFIFQMFGQVVATANSGFENRINTQTRTVNRVASGFVIDGALGVLSTSVSSGWAATDSTMSLTFTYYRKNTSTQTTGDQNRAVGTYTGGQFYGTSGYFGFRFSTDGGTNWNYGWAEATGGSGSGAPAVQITSWGYNDVLNQGIAAGAVPAPGAVALLGAAGLVGARRRRA
jgi:hypothetical protein